MENIVGYGIIGLSASIYLCDAFGCVFCCLFCGCCCYFCCIPNLCFCVIHSVLGLFCVGSYNYSIARLNKLNRLRHLNLIRLEKERLVGSLEEVDFSSELFRLKEEDLDICQVISSSGSISVVYKAKYKGEYVALKSFKTGQISSQDAHDDFEKQVKLFQSLIHKGIAKFHGVFLNPPRVGIVMEYCSHGDIRSYITKNPKLELSHRLRILGEIADVLEFLCSKDVIHQNLSADNILLTKDLTAKLIDFGLSMVISGPMSLEGGSSKQSSQYMAPEFTLSSKISLESTVFSFAILMYEIITNNFSPYGDNVEFNLELKVSLNPDFRPDYKKTCLYQVKSLFWMIRLMERMWNVDVKERPNWKEIVDIINSKKQETEEKIGEFQEMLWDWESDEKEGFPESELGVYNSEEVGGEDDDDGKEVDGAEIDDLMDNMFE